MSLDQPLLKTLPPPEEVRGRLGDALREVELLRGLLKLSEKAEDYRVNDGQEEESQGRVLARSAGR